MRGRCESWTLYHEETNMKCVVKKKSQQERQFNYKIAVDALQLSVPGKQTLQTFVIGW